MNKLIKLWYVIQIVCVLLMVALVCAETPEGQHSVASASANASPYSYASKQVPLPTGTLSQIKDAPPTS